MLAVVIAARGPDSAKEFIAALEGVASIVIEQPRKGAVQQAFSVRGFPSFFMLDERGRVAGRGPTSRILSAQRPAAAKQSAVT